MQAYMNRLTEARNRRLNAIARLDTALADTQKELSERQARLDTLADELEKQSALFAERTTERRGVVSNLDDRYGSEEEAGRPQSKPRRSRTGAAQYPGGDGKTCRTYAYYAYCQYPR